jgi:sec-independent protein translocase protein TatA
MTGWTSPWHIVLLLLIALLLFGAKRLPEIGQSLGKGMREFKGALMGDDEKKPELPAATPAPEPTAVAASPHEHDTA